MEKELQKLKRHEVLQLLLEQSEETAQLRTQLAETQEMLHELEETYERLRKRLDKKDMQIHGLRDMLTAQRNKREIELEEAGSIAEAALRLNGIFEAAQRAADQYLYNIELISEGHRPVKEEESEWEKLLDEEEEPFPPVQEITGTERPAETPDTAEAASEEEPAPTPAEEETKNPVEEETKTPEEEETEIPVEEETETPEEEETKAPEEEETKAPEKDPESKNITESNASEDSEPAPAKKQEDGSKKEIPKREAAKPEPRRRSIWARKRQTPPKGSRTGGRA